MSFEDGGFSRCCDVNCPDVGVDRPLVCALVFAVLFAYEEERWYSPAYLGLPLFYEGYVCMCVWWDS